MPTAQPGIFAQGTRSHRHLEFDANAGVEPNDVLAALRKLRQPSVTAGGANIVVGFRPSLWQRFDPSTTGIADFEIPQLDGLPRTHPTAGSGNQETAQTTSPDARAPSRADATRVRPRHPAP